ELEVLARDDPINSVHRLIGLRSASIVSRVRVAPEDGASVRGSGTYILPSNITTAMVSPSGSRPESRPNSGGKTDGMEGMSSDDKATSRPEDSGAAATAARSSTTGAAKVPTDNAARQVSRPTSAVAGQESLPEIEDDNGRSTSRKSSLLGPLPPILRGGGTSIAASNSRMTSTAPSRLGSARKGSSGDGAGAAPASSGPSSSLATAAQALVASVNGGGGVGGGGGSGSRIGSGRIGSGRVGSGRSRSSSGLPGGRLRFAASVKSAGEDSDRGADGAAAAAAATAPGFSGSIGRYGNYIPKPAAPNAFFGSAVDRPEYHFQESPIGMLNAVVSAKSLTSKLRSRSANARTAAETTATAATLAANAGTQGTLQQYSGVPAGTYGAYSGAAAAAATPASQLAPQGTNAGLYGAYGSGAMYGTYGSGSMYGTGTMGAAAMPVGSMGTSAAYDPAVYQQYAAYYAAMQQQYAAAAAGQSMSPDPRASYGASAAAGRPGAVPVRSGAGLTDMPGVTPDG
ncbi:hypothetical protein Vretifemale_12031, partial [Volvox reticuliferus]